MDENDEGDINDVARQADIRTEIEARRRACFGPPMTVDATQELHTAAQDHQDQLTQEERQSPSNPVFATCSSSDLISVELEWPRSPTSSRCSIPFCASARSRVASCPPTVRFYGFCK